MLKKLISLITPFYGQKEPCGSKTCFDPKYAQDDQIKFKQLQDIIILENNHLLNAYHRWVFSLIFLTWQKYGFGVLFQLILVHLLSPTNYCFHAWHLRLFKSTNKSTFSLPNMLYLVDQINNFLCVTKQKIS